MTSLTIWKAGGEDDALAADPAASFKNQCPKLHRDSLWLEDGAAP
jgi:hypothetical protein